MNEFQTIQYGVTWAVNALKLELILNPITSLLHITPWAISFRGIVDISISVTVLALVRPEEQYKRTELGLKMSSRIVRGLGNILYGPMSILHEPILYITEAGLALIGNCLLIGATLTELNHKLSVVHEVSGTISSEKSKESEVFEEFDLYN